MTFGELYEEYAGAVYSYLVFKLRDSQLAEDVLQDTFLAVHQNNHSVQEISSPKAWILAIARNKMVDALRKRPPVENVPVDTLRDVGCEPASDLFFPKL